jgi:O-antigen/teichoic acid export membrane protein
MRLGSGRPGDEALGRVAVNSSWLIGANVCVYALAFLQGVVLARALGPSGLGILAVVVSLVTVIQQLLGSRVWEAATKFVVEFRTAGDPVRATATVKACYLVDAVGGILAFLLITFLAAPAAEALTGTPAAASAIRLYALSAIITVPVATASALLRIANRFRWLAFESVAEGALRLIMILAIVSGEGRAIDPILGAYLLASFAGASAFVVLGRRAERELDLVPWRDAPMSTLRADRRRVVRFLAYSNLTGTARLVTSRLDVLIVGWLTTPRSVGLYRLARTVSDPLAGLANPVYQAVYPQVSELVHARDLDGVRRLTERIRRLGLAVVLPVCLVTVVAAPWVIPLVFGPAFREAVPLVQIMVWQLIWVPYLWLPGLLLSLDRPRLVAVFNGADAAAYIVMLLVLVPPFGAMGAAWATFLRFAIWTGAARAIAKRVDAQMELAWAGSPA